MFAVDNACVPILSYNLNLLSMTQRSIYMSKTNNYLPDNAVFLPFNLTGLINSITLNSKNLNTTHSSVIKKHTHFYMVLNKITKAL